MKTKQRTLAVLLLLALFLGGLLWLVTRSNAAEEAASSAAAEGTIPLSNFAIGDLEQLQYIYGGETITLNYDSAAGRWPTTRTIIWTLPPATPWRRRWHR